MLVGLNSRHSLNEIYWSLRKGLGKTIAFFLRIYSEIISEVLFKLKNKEEWHLSVYKISFKTAQTLYPLYKIVYKKDFSFLVRDIFADILTSLNRRSTIKLKIVYENLDVLIGHSLHNKPLILCTTHIRGVPYALTQILDQNGYQIYLVSSGPQRQGWSWGSSKPAGILQSRDNLFIKLRKVLKGKTAIIILTDYDYSLVSKEGLISPNIFYFAARFDYNLVFFSSLLQQDSSIKISFGQNLNCKNDGKAMAEDFADWINSKTGWKYTVQKPKYIKSQ